MAVLISATSGLSSNPNNWRVVDPLSFTNNETSGTTLTTTFVSSGTFSPSSNINIEGVAIKPTTRVGSSGTMSIRLLAGGTAYSGSQVVVNVTDIYSIPSVAVPSFYWLYLAFPTVIALTAGVTYSVQARTSQATQVSLGYSTTPTTNWIRAIVTTTTASPANADTLIIAGPHTEPGSSSSVTITFDNTSGLTFGGGVASFSAIEVGKNGTLNFQTSPNTDYRLLCNGNINIGAGGIFTIGTAGNPIPSNSSAVVSFTMSSANLFQINVRQFGSFYTYGATKSARALLGTNASAGVSTITASSTVDWNRNDRIVIAPTTNSSSAFDLRTMSTTSSNSTTIAISPTLSNAKTIWANTECEIINLTRNIRIVGMSSSFDCIHTYNGRNVVIDSDYTEYFNSVWSNSLVDTSTSSVSFVGCSFWNSTSRVALNDTNISLSTFVTIDDCVLHNVLSLNSNSVASIVATPSNLIIRDVWGIRSVSHWVNLYGQDSFTMDRCRWIASAGSAFSVGNNSTNNNPIYIRSCVMKCSTVAGFNFPNGAFANFPYLNDISNNKIYLNAQYGINYSPTVGQAYGWYFYYTEIFSNATSNINLTYAADFKMIGATLYGGPTQTSPIGVRCTSTLTPIEFHDVSMTTHSTADVSFVNSSNIGQLVFKNSLFGSTTEVNSPTTLLGKPSYVYSARHDRTEGSHIIWYLFGRLQSDTSIYRTSPRSLRITPLNATGKIESSPVLVPVKSGETVTIGVWVRRSVVGDGSAHNGNFPRLISKIDRATWGGSLDQILATASSASDGAWQYISGTTQIAIDDSAYQIVVDTDGTSGWVNVDDMFVSKQNSTKGFKYWSNASPVPSSTTNNGSSIIFL